MNRRYAKTGYGSEEQGWIEYFRKPEFDNAYSGRKEISALEGLYYGRNPYCVELFGDHEEIFIDVYED